MDTNVKKFKYSYLNKVLCVLLSFVMGVSSIMLTIGVVLTQISVYHNGKTANYTDMEDVRLNLSCGLREGVNDAHKDKTKLKTILEEKKKSACDDIERQIIGQINLDYNNDENEYLAYVTDDSEFSSDIYVKGIYYDYGNFYYYLDSDSNITIKNYKKTLRSDIEKSYDRFVLNALNDYNNYDDPSGIFQDGLMYRVEKNGKVIYNTTDLTPEEIMAKADSFKIENGVASAGDHSSITRQTLDYIMTSSSADFKAKDYKLYAYIDTKKNNPNAHNTYEALRQFCSMSADIDNMKVIVIPVTIVLLIVSIILAFYYFRLTGRYEDNSLAKLSFVDYIPLELQLGIVGGSGFGLGVLFLTLCEELKSFSMLAWILAGVIAVCWLLLFELCCSVSRYSNSKKKFYKHLLLYWLGFAIYRVLKFIVKLIVKFFKAWHKLNKKLFTSFKLYTYKPKSFVRNVILLSLAFFAGNIGLMMLIVFFFAIDVPVFGFIFIVLDMVANTLALRKVCLYFKSLDEIIYCASVHQDYAKDIEQLPASLKILANSMKYTNAELQNAINKAVKDERLRAELITNVSHDLKTPLTSIITYVDLLKNCDINDPKANEYIAVLDEKGAKLKRLIDDLIEASKVTSGNVSVNLAPMNLSELCLQSTVDVQSDFEKNNLNLVVKQGEKPVMITADGAKTFRVIENLLSNARKYSARGSRVYVSVYEENGQGVFEIKNISAEELDITPDELTERFVRGDKSRGKAEGNGLGLSIAKELCKVQNGTLTLSIDGDLFKAKVSFPLANK